MIKNILLIDDDEDDHLIFKEALAYVDNTVNFSCVFSGYEGVKLLETFTPDYVFLDVNMPALNGLDCLDMIKKNSRTSNIPNCNVFNRHGRSDVRQGLSERCVCMCKKNSIYPGARPHAATIV